MPIRAQDVQRPILLAHGIAPFDILIKAIRKLIGHSLSPDAARWFDANIGDAIRYFRNIQRALGAHGFKAYETSVGFASSVSQRAVDLQGEVNRILADGHYEKVNIIAHSMGGLDARHMILKEEMKGKVACLVTIGTPHLGTSFADWGLGALMLPDSLVGLLKSVNLDFTGFWDLTTASCQAFNQQAEAREAGNDVVYITYAASQEWNQVFLSLQPSWKIVHEREGANDGVVSVTSQWWQAELRGPAGVKRVEQRDFGVGADHLNELGWWHPWVNPSQQPEAYERTIQNVYMQIAEDLHGRGLYP